MNVWRNLLFAYIRLKTCHIVSSLDGYSWVIHISYCKFLPVSFTLDWYINLEGMFTFSSILGRNICILYTHIHGLLIIWWLFDLLFSFHYTNWEHVLRTSSLNLVLKYLCNCLVWKIPRLQEEWCKVMLSGMMSTRIREIVIKHQT